ncbi:hypothetical protein PHISCL_00595 [Aspergillus sclerotialis]|uniref:HAUS augmin-like complex subunit 6 N-terminal domain-containing protein n=1 Tax=Aspergillus sclerotialis TaxID=2070753 RepID=A0A3A2ZWC8_9EURO|nr:hypothetical protein PHISCL_00595 [Aspergillus sclerotialis]
MQASKHPRPKPPSWSTSSHLVVFIRNLRLLQLDQQEEWPNINLRTLSASSQNQRQRVKAIEWALYHLFAIWDPAGTQDKLRPFFPPLEPMQSVNLRAALFRAFSELKKNGELGRETIVRKTMLDDCKGEKFDELLAVFSTAVLRKVLTATSDDGPLNPAIKLYTAKGLTPEEYQLIVPLILAHRVSLGGMGERRARVRGTHEKFSELLDEKKTQLESRSKENPQTAIDESIDTNTLSREIKTNWLGSEEWAETLLNGGSQTSNDGFLELPFSKAWSKANTSSIEGLCTDANHDLLTNLESRVSHQQDRLRRWRDFRNSIHQRRESPSKTTDNSELTFRDHRRLTVASISKAVRQSLGGSYLTEDDQLLLSSMNEALARVDGKPHSSVSPSPLPPRKAQVDNIPAPETTDPTSFLPSPMHEKKEPLGGQESPVPEEPKLPSPPQVSDNGNSGSPTVHVSSDPEPAQEPEPQPSTFTLAERTRKSMSLIPPSKNNPQGRVRSRKPRPSFPVNQFETPRKQSSQSNEAPSGRSTPRDELFDDTADYASVFKSRPRVAYSPIISPAVHVSPIQEFDLNADGDEGSPYGVDYDGSDLMSSPLASARPRG